VVSIPITRAGSLAVVGRGIGNDCDALNHYAEQIPAIPLPVPLP
jgi:hypothetical protein